MLMNVRAARVGSFMDKNACWLLWQMKVLPNRRCLDHIELATGHEEDGLIRRLE